MFRFGAIVLVLAWGTPLALLAQEVDAESQIEEALLAAPESLRAGAAVLGIGGEERDGDPLTTLRPGTNELICLADDPQQEGFQVSCYHTSLEPYMRFGRAARARWLDRAAVMDARYAAYADGSLPMPVAAALYNLGGDSRPARGEDREAALGARLRSWVLELSDRRRRPRLPDRPPAFPGPGHFPRRRAGDHPGRDHRHHRPLRRRRVR